MIKHGKGGANTNKIGLFVEKKLFNCINNAFRVEDQIQFKTIQNIPHAIVGTKMSIYQFEKIGLVFNKEVIQKIKYKPQPDVFIYFPKPKNLWIIEIKNQDTSGTGWEKFEFGLFGYKNDVYKRIFNRLNVRVEGIYSGKHWNKIKYLSDVKEYVNRTYSKKLYSLIEIDDLIDLIKDN